MAFNTLDDLRNHLKNSHLQTADQTTDAAKQLLAAIDAVRKENDDLKRRLDKLEKRGPQPSGGF